MPADPEPSIALKLLQGYIWFDQSLQNHLAAQNMPTVNRTESMIMLMAASGVNRPTDLAKKLGLARQTINSAMRVLEQKQLIRLVEDPMDKRCKVIERSPQGNSIYVEALKGLAEAEKSLQGKIGKQRLKQLKTTLQDCWE